MQYSEAVIATITFIKHSADLVFLPVDLEIIFCFVDLAALTSSHLTCLKKLFLIIFCMITEVKILIPPSQFAMVIFYVHDLHFSFPFTPGKK